MFEPQQGSREQRSRRLMGCLFAAIVFFGMVTLGVLGWTYLR